MTNKTLYIYAGCNGSGKTTAFEGSLHYSKDIEYLNSDMIAKGLAPFNSAKVSIEAGRLLITKMNELLDAGKSFAVETTLSGQIYKQHIKHAKATGYNIILCYYWLNSVELAKARVANRTNEGGHNVPPADIERRYFRGINNLFSFYLPTVDYAFLYDNSANIPSLIAKTNKGQITIINNITYNKLHKTATGCSCACLHFADTSSENSMFEKMMEEMHWKYFPKVVEYKKLLRYPYNYKGDNGVLDILIHWLRQQQAQEEKENKS